MYSKPYCSRNICCFFTDVKIEVKSVFISFLIPVTPIEDTIYKKPSASLAIFYILFSDVGAIKEIILISYFFA